MDHPFLAEIRKRIQPSNDIPTVSISGGIDSCAVLHHVVEVFGKSTKTITVSFGNQLDETRKAERVAEHYGTDHRVISIAQWEYWSRLPFILRHFPFPRYNVWPWILIEKAQPKILYVGEGGNELFGYADRSFLEGWAGQIIWVWPTWETPCKVLGVELHAPLRELETSLGSKFKPELRYFKPSHKEIMKEIYHGILPEFVINQNSTPPSTAFYGMVGENFDSIQVMAAKAWLVGHGG